MLDDYDQPLEEKQKRNTLRGPLVRALINCLMESPKLTKIDINKLIKSAYDNTLELGGVISIEYYSGSVNSSNFVFKFEPVDGSAPPKGETNSETLRKAIVKAQKDIEKLDN
jgi:hypothetical protein